MAGQAHLPDDVWSWSSNSPTATACGSSGSSAGERIIANGTRSASKRALASAMRERRGVLVAPSDDLGACRLAVLHALADRRDARIVVAVDVERAAHPGEVVRRRSASRCPNRRRSATAGSRRRSSRAAMPSASSSTSLPAESAHRNDTTASIIDSSTCWPPCAALAGEQRGGDRLRRVQRRHLVGRGLAQEHRDAVVGIGLVGGEAAVRLDHGVVRAAIAVRADRAEPGERHVDDVGVDRRARRRSRARACPSRRAGSSG